MPDVARFRANDAFRFLNVHRVFFYSLFSLVAVWAVITNALKNYSNYYSIAIFLSRSSRSVLVLANFGILLTLLCGHVVQRIFFGTLRPNEVERLYDRLWFFITESLLAFTIFRDEFDTPFALMFGFLLFVKSFHWLASDRIEWMDQRPYPGPPLTFHFRMNILFLILWAIDLVMFVFAVEHTLSTGVGGMVLFASEYGILVASLMNTILKYCLSTYDLRRAGRRGGENAPPWENKSMWIFYIELITDFLKLTTYLVFFCVIIASYGLPLNIVRDVYVTARSFITRLKALHRYQTATRNMDQRYPNATEEELISMTDRTCIICREEMVSPTVQEPNTQRDGPNTTPKKLPCGHIFHFHCLRSWLERQQSCPTCRRNVLDEDHEGQMAGRPRNGLGQQPQQNMPGPQNPGNNAQDGNNPLGFIGRLFGAPNRFPNAPQGNLNNQGIVNGAQPGIFINYQVQYQIPRQQNNNLRAEQLQQLPAFPGFHGPGGAWQPWPVDDRLPPQPEAVHTSPERPQVNDHSSEGQPAASGSTETPSTQSFDIQDKTPSPREAARNAALRRLGESSETKSLPKATLSRSASGDVNSLPSTSARTTASPASSPGALPPQLIPLFDFDQSGQTHQHSLLNAFLVPSLVTGNAGPNVGSHTTLSANLQPGTSINIPSQLPPDLTEDQLARLDTLTRESIDERLRILENVSTTLSKCIDDLVRLRSALPQFDPPNLPTASTSVLPSVTTAAGNEGHDSTSNGKGKEKADIPEPHAI